MKKILVIEDNKNNMYLIKFILEKHKFIVLEAYDATTGLKLTTTEKPDLIIMDIQLPDLDGLEATRKIRTLPGIDEIPIIAVTSYAMAADKEKALAAGCNACVEKPIDPENIVEIIKKHLK